MNTGPVESAAENLRQELSAKSPVIDVALWGGQYPFRGIPQSSIVDLRERMRRLNIEHGVIAPYEGVFWENGVEAYDRMAGELGGEAGLEVWPVLRPGALAGVEKVLDRYRPKGMRLTPNYHGYRLSDAGTAELLELARRRGMIVQVFQRLADERWHWLLKVPGVDATDLDYLTGVHGDLKIVLSGLASVGAMAERMRQLPNLYADVSRVRGPQFGMLYLAKGGPVEKLLFGSLWPVQIIEATLWQVTGNGLDGAQQEAILGGNARRLLGLEAAAVG